MKRTPFVRHPAARRPLPLLAVCLLVFAALAAPAPAQLDGQTPPLPLDSSIEGREPMDESDEREPMDESDEREPMDESDEIVAGAFACAPRVRLEGRSAATLPPLTARLVVVTLASDGWLAVARAGVPRSGEVGAPAHVLDLWGRSIADLVAGEPVWLTAGTYCLALAAPAAGGPIELVAELE